MGLCSFCLKSGMLCQKCLAKLESGEVTELDLKVARILLSMEAKFPSLQNVNFHRAIDADNTLAIIVGQGDVPRLLGYGGKIIRTLGEETGKNVRVLESDVSERKFLEDLFAPLSIVTVNTIWLPDGTTETRVILRRKRRGITPAEANALKEITRQVRNIVLRVEFAD
jgi:transcription antitermination factor NusA-like protein